MEPQRKFFAVSGGALSYLDWGGPADAPRVLFLHANGFNANTYRQLLSPMADILRIQALDCRGFGLGTATADPAADISWNIFRDDLVPFLEALGEPVTLAGHSLGSVISLLTAVARPDLVRNVLAIEPVIHPYLRNWVMRIRQAAHIPHTANGLVEGASKRRAVFPDRDAVFNAYCGRGAFRSWPEQVLRDYIAGGVRDRADGQVELSCAPAWEAAVFRMSGAYVWDRLGRIPRPFAIVHGNVHSTCHPSVVARMHRLYPGTVIEQIDGASHFLPMEFPDVVRAHILRMAQTK